MSAPCMGFVLHGKRLPTAKTVEWELTDKRATSEVARQCITVPTLAPCIEVSQLPECALGGQDGHNSEVLKHRWTARGVLLDVSCPPTAVRCPHRSSGAQARQHLTHSAANQGMNGK